ncbi:MAG: DUF3291 domain-containing protein [Acidobacteriota bacterium]|nr:DUF3291 domain-containing protein [Acidobacteriota bacterium]
METQGFQLAQFNVARLLAPLEDPRVSGFVSQLETIYAAAESAPGFVWRMKLDDAPTLRSPTDQLLLVTLSVWESVEALRAFVYRGAHAGPLRRRAEWFEKLEGNSVVLWWVRRGTLPRVEQGFARLKFLRRNGPTAKAFTFDEPFPLPREAG